MTRWLLILLSACAGPSAVCELDATRCTGASLEVCTGAEWVAIETCNDICSPVLGCIECMPGERVCEGDVARRCAPDGSGYEDERCEPELGLHCDASLGRCLGACARENLGRSYIGCEYYPTVLGNPVPEEFSFAIAIASASLEPASIRIEGGALESADTFEVPPGGVVVRNLPWQPDLKLCSGPRFMEECDPELVHDVLAPGAAYRVRSTEPVVVYQFNPIEHQRPAPGEVHYSYSADASLLLPVNAWGRRYLAISRRGFGRWPGEIAIVAASTTSVRVTPTASSLDAPAGRTTSFALGAGDALELLTPFEDPTGTLIEADEPIQVISGHFATNVPTTRDAADHLEESMLPIEALGTRYFVTPTEVAIDRLRGAGLAEVQIVAADDRVELRFDPPQEGARTTLFGVGDSVVLPVLDEPIEIVATGRVLVAQSMVGGSSYGPTEAEVPLAGDPAMTIAVPVEQYRAEYLVHAPSSYQRSYVAVVSEQAEQVLLDGEPVDLDGTPIGASGFVVRHVALEPSETGNHALSGERPFGVLVYGYGAWTSYLYPGGLDVRPIGPE